jgi:hypothetical protein
MSSKPEQPVEGEDENYEFHIRTYTPDEILNDITTNPEPWVSDGRYVIDDLTDEEWEAFVEAIS